MPTVERMKPISLFVPFEPIERRSKDEPLIVEGYCFVNETVEGEGGVCIERAAMEEATPEYMRHGAVREMHQPIAAGTALSADWDDKGCRLRAKIVDPIARLKCEEGVYKGFSISIAPRMRVGNRIKQVKWGENSLVDVPKDPDALFSLYRAEGFDPNAEVEVEVLDETSTPDPASTAVSPDPPPTPTLSPTSLVTAGSEAPPVTSTSDGAALVPPPAEAQAPGAEADGGASSWEGEGRRAKGEGSDTGSDEQRAAIVEALRAAGLPEGLAASVTVAETGLEAAATADHSAGLVGLTTRELMEREELALIQGRAQTSATVPVRENLEGKKPAEETIERYIKEKDGKWCVYSESGKLLGEHETKAEAVAQLQAVEISKHKDEKDATQPKDEKRAADAEPDAWQAQMRRQLAEMRSAIDRAETAIMTGHPIPADAPSAILTDVEPPAPSDPETVSSPDGEALQRLATAETEITRLQVAHEEAVTRLATVTGERDAALTRLAASEAEVKRQKGLLDQPRDVPPARFTTHSLAREFLLNLGNEVEAETQRLQKAYEAAKGEAEAEKHGDITKRDNALERMMTLQALLAERGARQ